MSWETPEPRNATPGLSNVLRTPSPEPIPDALTTLGDLWVTNPDPWAELPCNCEVVALDLNFPAEAQQWSDFVHHPEQLEANPSDDPVPHYFARGLLDLPTQHLQMGVPRRARLEIGNATSTTPFPRIEPQEYGRFPEEDSDSDTTSNPDEPDIVFRYGFRVHVDQRHQVAHDPFNPEGPDYEWPELSNVDREIFGPE
ncbi:hypothetical protein EDD85DRAFT_960287 [Armillaria nabsnona]|nr:hypothetical protein EDD85DRAFT_960287 [Armillaria nabsnona]